MTQVRRIVGDMYVSVDEDREIRENYLKLYAETMESIKQGLPRTAELMPKIYDSMVRMNDEDIRKEYITQVHARSRISRNLPPHLPHARC